MNLRSSLRSLIVAAVVGTAASLGLGLSGREAKADVSLDTGTATYTLGYVNTTSMTPVGVTNSSNVPTGGYSLPTSGPLPNAVLIPQATANGYGWLNNTPTSSWIGPNANGTGVGTVFAGGLYQPGYSSSTSAPEGQFFYNTTFTLGAGSSSLSGGFYASDNQSVALYLNGHLEGLSNTNNSFTSFSSFSINSGDFNSGGTNVLTFDVFNEQTGGPHNSPSGLNVVGTVVTSVPEPSVLALIASGLPALGLMWNRRRRQRA